MKMSLIQLLLVALTLAAASDQGSTMTTTKGTAYLSETAELICAFRKPENLEMSSNLAYYWQNEADEVLYEFENGKLKTENINPKYINRKMTFQSNSNLLLHDVTMQDRRTYKCLVFNTTGWRLPIHKSEYKLDVIVNITIPKISILANRPKKFGNAIEVECSSRLCYPHPEGIIWTISNSSGTFNVEEEKPNIQNITKEIFSITGVLPIYVDVNTTVSCMIKANHSLKSEPCKIVIKAEPLPDDDSYALYIWITIGCLVGLLTIAIIIFVVLKLRTPQRSPAGSNQTNGNTNGIPLGESPGTNSDTPDPPAEQNSLLNGVETQA